MSREAADWLLYLLVRAEGHSRWYAGAVHRAVRWGGSQAYAEGDAASARAEMVLLNDLAGLTGKHPWERPEWQAEPWSELSDANERG